MQTPDPVVAARLKKLLNECREFHLQITNEELPDLLSGTNYIELHRALCRCFWMASHRDNRLYRRYARNFLHHATHVIKTWYAGRSVEEVLEIALKPPSRYCTTFRRTSKRVEQPAEPNVGLERCRKCGSRNTTLSLFQTRCSDEPMTEFWFCHDCKNRWRH